MAQREARQVHGPDLVGGRDLVLAEQIGEHLVSRVWLGSPGMPVERRYPHQAHHGRHVLPADDHPSKPQQVLEHPVAGDGVFPQGVPVCNSAPAIHSMLETWEAQQAEGRGDTSLNPEEDVRIETRQTTLTPRVPPGTLDRLAVQGA